MSSFNRIRLPIFIGSLSSGQITEIRVYQRKNVTAVDATTPEARTTVLQQTSICGVQIRVRVQRSINILTGVIRDVDHDISVEEITSLVRADTEVLNVRRLDESKTIRIILAGDKLPIYVKVGYVRYPVWPYENNQLQCIKYHKLGHYVAKLRQW